MAIDVYAPCPCGSGKKLKFCCVSTADEMDRISRLLNDHQVRQAQQLLEALLRKHPDNAWAITTQALVDLETGESGAASQRLRAFLEKHPENDFAVGLYATARLQHEGPEAARKDIQRALQRCPRRFPDLASGLLEVLSLNFLERGCYLAAREHLVLAMVFASEKNRENLFTRLLEFDHDPNIPYPLRSVHPLPQIQGEEPLVAEVKKAYKYTTVGCWDIAADLLQRLLNDQQAQTAELWHALGICRAAAGIEASAAEALHAAALHYRPHDHGAAVECEVLSQLLARNAATTGRPQLLWQGEIRTSVSKLLTQLDQSDCLLRSPISPDQQHAIGAPVAIYDVLDRPLMDEPALEAHPVEAFARILGTVYVFDSQDEGKTPAKIEILGVSDPMLDQQIAGVRAATAETVQWKDGPEPIGRKILEELIPFYTRLALPPRWPSKTQHAVLNRWRQHLVNDVWPQTPLIGLQGRTPLDAKSDPALKTELTAAVYVLDALCEMRNFTLDVDAMLARLELAPLPPLNLTPESSLSSITALQLQRLPLDQLTNEQLLAIVNRVLLIGHSRLTQQVLTTALNRPGCLNDRDVSEVYRALYEQSVRLGHQQQALEWIVQGRQHAQKQPHSFSDVLKWDLHELMVRLQDPTDPGLMPLLSRFHQYYLPKLPDLRPQLEHLCQVYGVTPPWVTGMGVAVAPGSLWTPEAAAEPVTAGKLWLPGE